MSGITRIHFLCRAEGELSIVMIILIGEGERTAQSRAMRISVLLKLM